MNEYQQQPNDQASHPQEHRDADHSGPSDAQPTSDSPMSGLIEAIQQRQEALRRLADQEGIPVDVALALREAANRPAADVIREACHTSVNRPVEQRLESILLSGKRETHHEEKKPMFSGTLYRLETGKMIGGVCLGLADYMRIDPAIVRFAFMAVPLLLFFTPLLFAIPLLYIGMWIVLPVKDTIQTN